MEIPAVGHSRLGWEIEVHLGLSRKTLDLYPHQKPGDIDVLLVPRFENDRFAERAMAVEVKRFFVPLGNRGKSPNKFGAAQTRGLFEDGFPFVGLLHLGLIEPADRNEWEDISQINSKYPFAEIGKAKVDLDSFQTSNRNIGRLEKLDIPAQAGFNFFLCT